MSQKIGVVGLAVMGENLALNIERNGFPVAVYNRSHERTEAFLEGRGRGKRFAGARTYRRLASLLEKPRRVLLMVKAGAPVDAVIKELRPHLDKGDIIIDGGNSHYPDTDRRIAALKDSGIHFFGVGVSGGEEGALWGPSLMPGGERKIYRSLEPILKKIAAQVDSGPCVTYIGAGSSGHFVKMVHNGIEYGDMQLIAESYDLMRYGLGMEPAAIADTFAEWNQGELKSFLIEITANIVNFPDDRGRRSGPLLDKILDQAGQKGTGRWTIQAALDLGVAVPTMTAAVDARIVSAMTQARRQSAKAYETTVTARRSRRNEAVRQIRSALYASKICSYAQGFDMLRAASERFEYGLRPGEIARIWKGGCIIRAVFLDRIRSAFERQADLPNLLLDRDFQKEIRGRMEDWRRTVGLGIQTGIATPAMSASLAYMDSLRRRRLPANLIQAQRDYFGAHTYERVDRKGTFHTAWPTNTDS